MERIGRISKIRRYPVKSMMGEDLATAILAPYGMVGDRVYAFIDDQNHNPRFPWMTARNANEMLLFKPNFLSDKEVVVRSPSGREYSITDPALERYFEEKYNFRMTLKYRESGCHDSKPVSLISSHTIESLGGETGLELAGERFRANIYVDWDNRMPFYEDELLGREINGRRWSHPQNCKEGLEMRHTDSRPAHSGSLTNHSADDPEEPRWLHGSLRRGGKAWPNQSA